MLLSPRRLVTAWIAVAMLLTVIAGSIPAQAGAAPQETAGSIEEVEPVQVPELVTDRPDQTESASTVAKGLWQLELGYLLLRDNPGTSHSDELRAAAGLLRIGVSSRVELRVGWVGYSLLDQESPAARSRVSGTSDGGLGAKFGLVEGSGLKPQVALLVGTSLPIGDDEFTSDHYDPGFRFALSHQVSPRIDLGYNIGMAWLTTIDDAQIESTESLVQYTLAAGFALTETVGAYVEIFGDQPTRGGEANQTSFDGGFTWGLRDNLQLDLEGGIGLTDGAPDWFAGLGLVIRWPR